MNIQKLQNVLAEYYNERKSSDGSYQKHSITRDHIDDNPNLVRRLETTVVDLMFDNLDSISGPDLLPWVHDVNRKVVWQTINFDFGELDPVADEGTVANIDHYLESFSSRQYQFGIGTRFDIHNLFTDDGFNMFILCIQQIVSRTRRFVSDHALITGYIKGLEVFDMERAIRWQTGFIRDAKFFLRFQIGEKGAFHALDEIKTMMTARGAKPTVLIIHPFFGNVLKNTDMRTEYYKGGNQAVKNFIGDESLTVINGLKLKTAQVRRSRNIIESTSILDTAAMVGGFVHLKNMKNFMPYVNSNTPMNFRLGVSLVDNQADSWQFISFIELLKGSRRFIEKANNNDDIGYFSQCVDRGNDRHPYPVTEYSNGATCATSVSISFIVDPSSGYVHPLKGGRSFSVRIGGYSDLGNQNRPPQKNMFSGKYTLANLYTDTLDHLNSKLNTIHGGAYTRIEKTPNWKPWSSLTEDELLFFEALKSKLEKAPPFTPTRTANIKQTINRLQRFIDADVSTLADTFKLDKTNFEDRDNHRVRIAPNFFKLSGQETHDTVTVGEAMDVIAIDEATFFNTANTVYFIFEILFYQQVTAVYPMTLTPTHSNTVITSNVIKHLQDKRIQNNNITDMIKTTTHSAFLYLYIMNKYKLSPDERLNLLKLTTGVHTVNDLPVYPNKGNKLILKDFIQERNIAQLHDYIVYNGIKPELRLNEGCTIPFKFTDLKQRLQTFYATWIVYFRGLPGRTGEVSWSFPVPNNINGIKDNSNVTFTYTGDTREWHNLIDQYTLEFTRNAIFYVQDTNTTNLHATLTHGIDHNTLPAETSSLSLPFFKRTTGQIMLDQFRKGTDLQHRNPRIYFGICLPAISGFTYERIKLVTDMKQTPCDVSYSDGLSETETESRWFYAFRLERLVNSTIHIDNISQLVCEMDTGVPFDFFIARPFWKIPTSGAVIAQPGVELGETVIGHVMNSIAKDPYTNSGQTALRVNVGAYVKDPNLIHTERHAFWATSIKSGNNTEFFTLKDYQAFASENFEDAKRSSLICMPLPLKTKLDMEFEFIDIVGNYDDRSESIFFTFENELEALMWRLDELKPMPLSAFPKRANRLCWPSSYRQFDPESNMIVDHIPTGGPWKGREKPGLRALQDSGMIAA